MSKTLGSGKNQPVIRVRSITEESVLDIESLNDAGRIEVLGKLYDKYAPSLLGFIASIVSNNQIAEETLQHCFVEIWQRFKYYNASKERLFIWMFRIARSSAIAISLKNNAELKLSESEYVINARIHSTLGHKFEGEDKQTSTE